MTQPPRKATVDTSIEPLREALDAVRKAAAPSSCSCRQSSAAGTQRPEHSIDASFALHLRTAERVRVDSSHVTGLPCKLHKIGVLQPVADLVCQHSWQQHDIRDNRPHRTRCKRLRSCLSLDSVCSTLKRAHNIGFGISTHRLPTNTGQLSRLNRVWHAQERLQDQRSNAPPVTKHNAHATAPEVGLAVVLSDLLSSAACRCTPPQQKSKRSLRRGTYARCSLA